ncbi:MAG: MarR family transcriptional regulator [Lachnospiraceae bacterium]|nr:MarR family transcriptional regulator [Lachnospiraceae bacterium]
MSTYINNNFSNFGRCISILDRLMKMYYDHGLAEFEIGWGQQFYVEYIYDHPGATAQEMVECIRVDKATLTKVIKKLKEIGYIRIVRSENDKRSKLLYLTDKAVPAARRIKEIHSSFYSALCSNILPLDIRQAEKTMEQMMENISQKVWHRMEDFHGE